MSGALYIISMLIVKKLALDCPYLCIGMDPNLPLNEDLKKPCFWGLEDAFIGSCIYYTQKKARFTDKQNSFREHLWRDIARHIDRWVETGEKPVMVHFVNHPKYFEILQTSFGLLESLPRTHNAKQLLPIIFRKLS